MKIFILPPHQIPHFWEHIKVAAKKADELDEKHHREYFTELLHALLSSKAQCGVVIDDNRDLIALFITRFVVSKLTGEKQLNMQLLYAWAPIPDYVFDKVYDIYTKMARDEGCKSVIFTTHNKRVLDRVLRLGFTELERTYILQLEGGVI